MPVGPCGVEFREAFSCFQLSDTEPKGLDCIDMFKTMSACMNQFPGVYNNEDDQKEELPPLEDIWGQTESDQPVEDDSTPAIEDKLTDADGAAATPLPDTANPSPTQTTGSDDDVPS